MSTVSHSTERVLYVADGSHFRAVLTFAIASSQLRPSIILIISRRAEPSFVCNRSLWNGRKSSWMDCNPGCETPSTLYTSRLLDNSTFPHLLALDLSAGCCCLCSFHWRQSCKETTKTEEKKKKKKNIQVSSKSMPDCDARLAN